MIASLLSCLLGFFFFSFVLWSGISVEVAVDIIFFFIFLERPVRATPNHKMEANSSVHQKDKMKKDFACPIPFQWGRFLRRGDGSFQVIWRSDLERTQNYCVKLLSLYLRRIII